jgi:hypothetical protein
MRILATILGARCSCMALARFGGGFLSARGLGSWDVLPYMLLAGYLALWIPGVDRLLERPLVAAFGVHTERARHLDPPSPRG